MLCFAAVTALAAVLYRVEILRNYYAAIVAGLLLYAPSLALRGRELGDYGLTHRPLGRSLRLAGSAIALVFPLFLGLYLGFQHLACRVGPLRPLAPGACHLETFSAIFVRARFRLPPEFAELALGQLVVVALPEEHFFRGYVQGRLAETWPGARAFLGVKVRPIVVASALFALCHVIVQGNLATAAVFFPGLAFGWMRARTGSIFAGTLFHAACNLYIEILGRSFFG